MDSASRAAFTKAKIAHAAQSKLDRRYEQLSVELEECRKARGQATSIREDAIKAYHECCCRSITQALYAALPLELRDIVWTFAWDTDLDHFNKVMVDDVWYLEGPHKLTLSSQYLFAKPEFVGQVIANEALSSLCRMIYGKPSEKDICAGTLDQILLSDHFIRGFMGIDFVTSLHVVWSGSIVNNCYFRKALENFEKLVVNLTRPVDIEVSFRQNNLDDSMGRHALAEKLKMFKPTFLAMGKKGHRVTTKDRYSGLDVTNFFEIEVADWLEDVESRSSSGTSTSK